MYKLGQKLQAEEFTTELRDWLNSNNYYCKDINEGEFVYEIAEPEPFSDEEWSEIRREERKYECFPFINRGELWYAQLTAEQRAELTKWYQDWLDAPSTLVKPSKPDWLV